MSALNIETDIPNAISTVEQHFVWCGTLMGFIYPSLQILETEAGAVNAVQTGIFKTAENKTRIYIRGSIELEADYIQDRDTKLWMKAKELGNVVIPDSFKTN